MRNWLQSSKNDAKRYAKQQKCKARLVAEQHKTMQHCMQNSKRQEQGQGPELVVLKNKMPVYGKNGV